MTKLDEFIEKAKRVHCGEDLDYSQAVYVNSVAVGSGAEESDGHRVVQRAAVAVLVLYGVVALHPSFYVAVYGGTARYQCRGECEE